MKQRPKAVLFDLGNTLVSYYKPPDFAQVLDRIVYDLVGYLMQHGRSFASERALLEKALSLNVERSDQYVFPLMERLKIIFDLTYAFVEENEAELSRRFLKPIFATAILDDAALPLLAELRARGFKTGIISNTPWGSPAENWHRELARHGLGRAVDTAVFCVECGRRKPHPDIFRFALQRLGIEAGDAVFVGDDERWDVSGALNVGMRPVLLEPAAIELEEGVERIGNLGELLTLLERTR